MRVKDNSAGTRNSLISLAMICGCIPYKKMNLLNKVTLTYMRKAKEMIHEGIFEEHKEKFMKNEPAKLLTLAGNTQARGQYEYVVPKTLADWYDSVIVNDAYQIRVQSTDTEQQTRKIRITRNAETIMFFMGIEFDVLKGEYPDLRSDKLIHENIFYTSRQVKGIYESDETRFKADIDRNQQLITTRMNGLALTKGGNYQVYNIGRTISTYSYTGESKIKEYTNRMLAEKDIDRADSAIMLAEWPSIYERIYTPRHIREERGIDGLMGAYTEVLGLTLDENGQKMMKMIASGRDWKDRIYKSVLSIEQRKNVPMDSPADGVDKDRSIFVYCIPDIKRFRMYLNRAKLIEDKDNHVVLCYDFQKEMLERVIGKYAKVFSIGELPK